MRMRFRHRQGVAPFLIAAALALAGCGSVPQTGSPVADSASRRQSAPAPGTKGLPVLPPAGSGRGGYYQDDGPGDKIPDGLYDTPDAEPKIEPYSSRGNRPYVVFGKTYTPITDDRPFRQRGLGSWYGKKFHGQKTSSGELYDMYKMTAAHPTLPIPSYARVTNVASGKQIIVRVNDRGPFHSSRIIDLSYTAALKLGYISHGSTILEVERLLPDEIARMTGNKQPGPQQPQPMAPMSSAAESAPLVQPASPGANTSTADALNTGSSMPALITIDPSNAAAAGGFYLQLGAYTQEANAEAVRTRLARDWIGTLPSLEVVQNGVLYRIYSGPFANRSDADAAIQQLQTAGVAKPVIVQRQADGSSR
ncbi:MAG: septal ring lytic transglycosylase RlpA family protein [Herminiimonas sp.]|nr:septal ring lytic transglycosylase RlpA family protein [Herminiimonas sp.]